MEITSIKIKLSDLEGVLCLAHVSSKSAKTIFRKSSLFTESYLNVNVFLKFKQDAFEIIQTLKTNEKQLK